MKFLSLSSLAVLALLVIAVDQSSSYQYKTSYFDQLVDHFSFQTNATYKQRYLISTKYWNKHNGPIFIYIGNEGDIEVFANNTGFMWEIAPQFGAMVVFSEHRFYGKSFPYPQREKKFGLLTSEQAIADHARLVVHLKNTIDGASYSPVIGFGGSYGGMLASWMRIKYPHILDGALAASAPIVQFTGMVTCDTYAKSVTKAYRWGGDQCPKVIRKAFDLVDRYAKTQAGLKNLTRIFRLCKPLEAGSPLIAWISNGLSSVAMANYPYPNDFLGPLPAWPVKKMCNFLRDSTLGNEQILSNLRDAMSVYYNRSSSQPKCIDLAFTPMASLGAENWNYQACTEMIMPMCQTGVYDMFLPEKWNLTQYSETCSRTYGVTTRPYMVELMYGGAKLEAASNIIFSNGEIDPWSGGGIHKNINPTVVALSIADGAHHLDLRESNKLDPPSVTAVRNIEKKWIRVWIDQAKNRGLQ